MIATLRDTFSHFTISPKVANCISDKEANRHMTCFKYCVVPMNLGMYLFLARPGVCSVCYSLSAISRCTLIERGSWGDSTVGFTGSPMIRGLCQRVAERL